MGRHRPSSLRRAPSCSPGSCRRPLLRRHGGARSGASGPRLGCLGAGVVLLLTGAPSDGWIDPVVAVGALYLLSLGILELAQRLFGGSVETDFQRGHVVVSVVWALIGLALLVAGLLRDGRCSASAASPSSASAWRRSSSST